MTIGGDLIRYYNIDIFKISRTVERNISKFALISQNNRRLTLLNHLL